MIATSSSSVVYRGRCLSRHLPEMIAREVHFAKHLLAASGFRLRGFRRQPDRLELRYTWLDCGRPMRETKRFERVDGDWVAVDTLGSSCEYARGRDFTCAWIRRDADGWLYAGSYDAASDRRQLLPALSADVDPRIARHYLALTRCERLAPWLIAAAARLG